MILSVVIMVVVGATADETIRPTDQTPHVYEIYNWTSLPPGGSEFALLSAISRQKGLSSPECGLPDGLAKEIAVRYPGTTLVTLGDLDEYDRRLFRKDHGDRCPGVVKVDFFGDRKPTWALLLLQHEAARRTATLVVARQIDSGWEIKQLDAVDAGRSTVPVVWREGPGKYIDVYGQKSLRAKHPTIVLCGYESWAILYAWTGKAVEKIWISD